MPWETLKDLRWRPHGGGKLRPLCAGSGLARVRGGFWVIADDLNHAVFIPDGKSPGAGRRIFPGTLPTDVKRRKKLKKDIESLIDLGGGKLVAFPSGSKHRRCRGALLDLNKTGRFRESVQIDFRPLMELLGKAVPDLNIEGGFVRGSRVILLQRGNGRAGFNGVVKMRLKAFTHGMKHGEWKKSSLGLKIKKIALGSFGKVALTFTDGFFLDGTAYYAAAAEAGDDTYEDGKIHGSAVGLLRKGGRPVELARLKGEKLEGLAPGRRMNGLLEIFAVTDDDDPSKPSKLMRTWIKTS